MHDHVFRVLASEVEYWPVVLVSFVQVRLICQRYVMVWRIVGTKERL